MPENEDKQLLVDYRTLEYDKNVIKESVDSGGPLEVEGILQRAEAENQNGRIYPKKILKREAKKYMKNKVNENRALGELDHPECIRRSADILTSEGWKSVQNIDDDEKVYTLNTDTNEIELQKITKKVDEAYDGKMIRVKGRNIDTLVTPNHRFYLIGRDGGYFATAQEIHDNPKKHRHSYIPNTGMNGWGGTENSYNGTVEINGVSRKSIDKKYKKSLNIDSDIWFKFLGIFLADDSSSGDSNQITITQKKPETKEKIRNLLSQFPEDVEWKENKVGNGKVHFSCNDARLNEVLEPLGDCYSKYVPVDVKKSKKEHLEKLYEWYRIGDGRDVDFNGYNRKEVFSVSEKMIDDFHEILLKIGKSGSKTVEITEEDYEFAGHEIKADNKEPLHILHESTTKGVYLDPRYIEVEEVNNFDDRVYCVSVPNETIYLRDKEKAFWSGNSSVVNLKNVSHNVTDMWWEGNDLYGKLEILSTPSGEIAKELMLEGIKLGISSRGLGSVSQNRDGTVTVKDDFEIVSWDLVSSPSTHGAFVEPINEVKNPEKNDYEWSGVDRIAQDIVSEISDEYHIK